MKKLLLSSIILTLTTVPAWACDSCGCVYCNPGSLSTFETSGNTGNVDSFFFATVGWQFTDYGTLRSMPAGGASLNQYEDSSQTQFLLGYQFNNSLNVQISIPYIYRWYQIDSGAGLVKGDVQGFGDTRVIANYIPLSKDTGDWKYSWRVSGGVKIPTGDPNLLSLESPNYAGTDALAAPTSAVGGHDVALGSGSYDLIVGTGFSVEYQRWFMDADMDYQIRGTGYDGYRYANEVSLDAGPGYRIVDNSAYKLSLQLVAAGEHKGADTAQDQTTPDTSITQLMLGPRVLLTWGDKLTANLGLELPVMQEVGEGFQAVATYRLKGDLQFRF
jgi:hypothetical protein